MNESIATLPPDVLRRAMEAAATISGLRDVPVGVAVCFDENDEGGRYCFYPEDAWEKPKSQPFLPWSPPALRPVARVDQSGAVTPFSIQEAL